MNATDTLRGTVADCQDVLSAPDVDRAMRALAKLETLLQTAEDALANEILVRYDNAADPMWNLAAAVRDAKGDTT